MGDLMVNFYFRNFFSGFKSQLEEINRKTTL